MILIRYKKDKIDEELTFLNILTISSLSWLHLEVMAELYISARAAWSRPAFFVSFNSCFQISWLEKVPHPWAFAFWSFCLLLNSFARRSRSRLKNNKIIYKCLKTIYSRGHLQRFKRIVHESKFFRFLKIPSYKSNLLKKSWIFSV